MGHLKWSCLRGHPHSLHTLGKAACQEMLSSSSTSTPLQPRRTPSCFKQGVISGEDHTCIPNCYFSKPYQMQPCADSMMFKHHWIPINSILPRFTLVPLQLRTTTTHKLGRVHPQPAASDPIHLQGIMLRQA